MELTGQFHYSDDMRRLSDRKREGILGAAAAVFARKGYHRALVDEVARAAGVGKGTVYRYFSDKEDLFFSIIDQGIDRLIAAMARASRSGGCPRDSLRGIFEALAEFARENRPIVKLIHQVEPRQRIKRFERIRRQNRRILAITEAVIRRGMRSGHFRRGDARLWALAAASAANSAFMTEGPRSTGSRTAGALLDLMLHGMSSLPETEGGRGT